MRKIIFVLALLFSASNQMLAQDNTYSSTDRKAQLSKDSLNVEVMVIPASTKLYRSFYDKQMMEANNLSFEELRDTILSTLASKVALAFNDSVPSGVILESKTGYPEDMDFVYESIEYTYDLLPEPKKKETSLGKWKKKLKKKDDKPAAKTGTYMEGGQIVSNPDYSPKFTNIKVLNSDFLYILNKRYHANTFVFINHYEMTIAEHVAQNQIQSDNYARVIKVHYTIVDVNGKEIQSGMAVRNSSSYDNKLDYLIGTSFYLIGQQIKHDLENR